MLHPNCGCVFFRISLIACLSANCTFGAAIDFEDGTGHNVVIPANHYPGLTFSNAVWQSQHFQIGNFGLGVDAGVLAAPNDDYQYPGTTSPIVIEFQSPVTFVSIDARDVGRNGAQLAAFDSSNMLLGIDNVVGGPPPGIHQTLFVDAVGIKRIELTQHLYPSADQGDGVAWDNLTFIPEPSVMGIAAVFPLLLRRRIH